MNIPWHPTTGPSLNEIADALGFEQDTRGHRTRRGLRLTSEGHWLVLTSPAASTGDPAQALLGARGPWRVLRGTEQWTLGCELPLNSRRRGESEPTRASLASIESLVTWAETTADGSLPSDYRPPGAEDVEQWISPRQRNLRAGSLIREVEMIATADRLTLSVSPIVRIPDDLPATRRSWIDELCLDAQQSWRLIRFGVDEQSGCVRAEVDLSGVPSEAAEPLAELGLAALTAAVVWALPGLAIAIDPGVESQVLDRGPTSHGSRRAAKAVVPTVTKHPVTTNPVAGQKHRSKGATA